MPKRERVTVEVEIPKETTTTTKETTETTAKLGEVGDVQANVSDVRDRLAERLQSAQESGLVEAIEIKGSASRKRTTQTEPEEVAPSPLADMDLEPVSDMFWDAVGKIRGYNDAGIPVEKASKKRWAEALQPVLAGILGELMQDHPAEFTLLLTTLIIVAPREYALFRHKREQPKPDIGAS